MRLTPYTITSNLWLYLPSGTGILTVLYLSYLLLGSSPPLLNPTSFDRFTDGALSSASQSAINLIKDLISYTTTSSTLLFAAFGAFFLHFKPRLPLLALVLPILSSLILLISAHIYGYLASAQIIGELAHNILALKPGDSRIIYYLEREFNTALASIMTLLISFLVFSSFVMHPRGNNSITTNTHRPEGEQ